jgi:hypothetical protein
MAFLPKDSFAGMLGYHGRSLFGKSIVAYASSAVDRHQAGISHEGSIVFRATLTFGRRRSPAKRPFDLEAAMVGKG